MTQQTPHFPQYMNHNSKNHVTVKFGFITRTSLLLSFATLNVFGMNHYLDYVALDTVPFDAYVLKTFVFVIDRATNKSVPILRFASGEGPDNFVLSSVGGQTNNTWTYDPGTGPTTVVVESSWIEIVVKRSQLAQAFTVCLLLANAALTAGSVYVTLLVTIRREGVNDALLLLPVSTILTIPALRGLYAGSPPFGIYLGTPMAFGSQLDG